MMMSFYFETEIMSLQEEKEQEKKTNKLETFMSIVFHKSVCLSDYYLKKNNFQYNKRPF